MGPFRASATRGVLDYFEQCLDATQLTWPEAIDRVEVLEAELKKRSTGTLGKFTTMPLTLFSPVIANQFIAGARAESRTNITVLALAAARYRLRQGHLPNNLDDISPEFLPPSVADVRIDHFDGQPLRFKSDDTGITIYSIGGDLKDDGGEIKVTPGTEKRRRAIRSFTLPPGS